jgi:hypothetical protein
MHCGELRSETDHGARLAVVGACRCLLALSAGSAIGVTPFDDPLSEGLPIYVPCILFLITEFTGVADGRRRRLMPTQSSPEVKVDPRRYFESAEERRGGYAARQPVCIYLEMTNRCNLLCTTSAHL